LPRSSIYQEMARVEAQLEISPTFASCPVLIMLSGLPGTGKSHLANLLGPRLGLTIIRTDQVRKILFPEPTYSGSESGFVFQVAHGLIEELLMRGKGVIFDATNLSESGRSAIYRIADRAKARLLIVETVASDEVVARRLQKWAQDNAERFLSDATLEVYERMKSTKEPIRRRHRVINTEADVAATVEAIAAEVEGRGGQSDLGDD
jgi:predicted kinase